MAYIEPDFIEQLCQEANIVEVIGRSVKLQRRGSDYIGLCPFHDEKSPSFSVSPSKQVYYCFGCGEGGNVYSFLQNYGKVGFVDAVEQLASIYGRQVPRVQSDVKRKLKRQEYQSREQAALALLQNLSAYFGEQLRAQASGPVGAYLQERGLFPETVQAFALGYAPSTPLIELYPEQKDLLVELGLAYEDERSGRNPLADRLIFPIRDAKGRVMGFGGRALRPEHQPKYLNSKDSLIYHKGELLYGLFEAIQQRSLGSHLIFCEGYMDVIMLAQHGAGAAVAGLGTALTESQLALGFRYAQKLLFAFDGDAAGKKAAVKAMFTAFNQLQDGRGVDFVFLPEGEDPDSFIQKQGLEAWSSLLQQAQPLSRFLQDYARERYGLDSVESRSRCAHELMPELARIPEGIFKSSLLQSLKGLLQLPDDYQQPQPVVVAELPRPPAPRITTNSRAHQLLSRVTSLIYANPESIPTIAPQLLAELQADESLADLYQLIYQICEQYSERGYLDDGYFLGGWHDSDLLAGIKSALLEPIVADGDAISASIGALLRMQTNKAYQQRIAELSARDFASLSSSEHSELRGLLAALRANRGAPAGLAVTTS